MSNGAINLIEDTCSSLSNIDVETETHIANLCLDLKKLEANHPEIILTDIQVNITKLLQRLDGSLASVNNSEFLINDLQCSILTLESRLEWEKQQRKCDLNASFNELDVIREEKDFALEKTRIMSSSLVNVKSKLESKTSECLSLQSAIDDKDKIIDNIRLDLEASNKQKIELADLVINLKSSVKKAEENSWLKSRWVDDAILDGYFQSFNDNVGNELSKVIFMGPSVTQVVKHGSAHDVKDLLVDLGFFNVSYAFLCISNNPATLNQDNGSHWSLVFVDIACKSVFHLDSLQGTNSFAAKNVTTKLGFNVSDFYELSCTQQSNNYECGLNVLVNTKFINEGFCRKLMPGKGFSFYDWYKLFNGGSYDLIVADVNEVLPVQPTATKDLCNVQIHEPANVNISVKDLECVNCDDSLVNHSETWEKVKYKRKCKNRTSDIKYSRLKNKAVKSTNRFLALESEIISVHNNEIMGNSSGKWKIKSLKVQKNKKKDSSFVNASNDCFSKAVGEPFSRSNVLYSNVRENGSNNTSSLINLAGDSTDLIKNVADKGSASRDIVNKDSSTLHFNKTVLLIGDSIIRYACVQSANRGAMVECCPGGKIRDIKERLMIYTGSDISVLYVHVGTNNLRKYYRGRAGYNGGHGKREALHEMADLLFTIKTHFPNTMVFINSILVRSDITYTALYNFNEQIELMCSNFNVNFVEANCWVQSKHLARDGRHLNRSGHYQLGSLFLRVFTVALDQFQINATVGGLSCGIDSDGDAREEIVSPVGSGRGISHDLPFLGKMGQKTL